MTSRLNDSVVVIDVGDAQGPADAPGGRRAARGRGRPVGQDALRDEHRLRRRLGRRRRDRQGDEAPRREPQPVVGRPLAGRQAAAGHERALALRASSARRRCPRSRSFDVGRPEGRGPLGRAGGEPAPGRRLAPERRVRAGDAQPHQEPGADDPPPAGLDDHQRPRGPLEGRPRRPGAARRAAALLRRRHRRRVHARRQAGAGRPARAPTASRSSTSRSCVALLEAHVRRGPARRPARTSSASPPSSWSPASR